MYAQTVAMAIAALGTRRDRAVGTRPPVAALALAGGCVTLATGGAFGLKTRTLLPLASVAVISAGALTRAAHARAVAGAVPRARVALAALAAVALVAEAAVEPRKESAVAGALL